MFHADSSPAHAASATDAAALWARFARTDDVPSHCRAWLALQCGQLRGVRAGVVLWREADGGFAPQAVWPSAQADLSALGDIARQALTQRRGLTLPAPAEGGDPTAPALARVAYPIAVGEEVFGVVVLELAAGDDRQLQAAMRSLHWGAGWLEKLARDGLMQPLREQAQRAVDAGDVLALTLEQDSARAAAMALCNDIAQRLGAQRVLLGVVQHSRVRLEAISHTAWFDLRNAAVAAAENVMEEALDQQATVCAPQVPGEPHGLNVAHDEHRRASGLGAVVSVPLPGREAQVAVLTAEFDAAAPPGPATLRWLEAVALLAGPALEDKLALRRWWAGRVADGVRGLWVRLTQRGHARWKLGTAIAAAVVAALVLVQQDYRVTAQAVIEGEIQRAAVAPFRGYIAEAPVRAGATVERGQLLASLDERDLRLEQVRWRSELEQAAQKHRDALAKHERPSVVQFAAQMRQAQAQLDLVDEKLTRARITAPIDGLVVSGDLSQMLGSPVDVGETLFEIAPLDAYRVVLYVDERDVGQVAVGQGGQLVLAGLVRDPLGFTVSNVTAVSETRDGSNVFRVEAQLVEPPPALRPGMEGVGKVAAGEREVWWVWTHPLLDWMRLAAWRWLP